MRCILLGAGEGTRLRPHTLSRPKCLVELAGKPLLRRQIEALETAGITNIHVVTGYRAEAITALGVDTVHNPEFATTNMVASLMTARSLLDGRDDVLVSYTDIVFEPKVVEALRASDAGISVCVNAAWERLWRLRMAHPLEDAETLRMDPSGNILELGRRPSSYADVEAQYMGLIVIRSDHVAKVVEIYDGMDPDVQYDGVPKKQMYMTTFLQHIIDSHLPIRAVVVDGGWLEVDTSDELTLYNRLYEDGQLTEFCQLT